MADSEKSSNVPILNWSTSQFLIPVSLIYPHVEVAKMEYLPLSPTRKRHSKFEKVKLLIYSQCDTWIEKFEKEKDKKVCF